MAFKIGKICKWFRLVFAKMNLRDKYTRIFCKKQFGVGKVTSLGVFIAKTPEDTAFIN